MATARNDVTGDIIQSKILSKEGRDNWDYIFVKRTPKEWVKLDKDYIHLAHLFEGIPNEDLPRMTRLSFEKFYNIK